MRRTVLIVLAAALAVRVAAVLLTPGYLPAHDDAAYARYAMELSATGHFPVTEGPGNVTQPASYRAPGWPALLALLWNATGVSLPGARLALAALGAGACALVAAIAGRLWGPGEALAAGLLAAGCPLLVATGTSLESETLFVALTMAATLLALRARGAATPQGAAGWAAAAGAGAGAAALTRSNGLILLPAIALLALPRAVPWRGRIAVGLVAALCAVAVIAPWTARNARDLHAFVPVSTEAGNTLAGTYNPWSARADARWLEPRRTGAYRWIYRHHSGAALDAALVRAVGRWVARHPAYPANVLAANALRLTGLDGPRWTRFSLWTMSVGTRLGATVWVGLIGLVGLAAAGTVVLARRRDAGPAALWALPALLFLTAALTNGEQRLVVPALPFLCLLAGVAVSRAGCRARRLRA